MNDPILELWEESRHIILEKDVYRTREVFDTFAKLIVQKCLDQCYNRGMNDELYAGQLKAAAYIEEYFGVDYGNSGIDSSSR